MENEFIEILGIYPGMYASKFKVRVDSWEHYCDLHLNSQTPGNCFLPCRDSDGDALFVDMTKLLAFYVLTAPEKKPESPPKTNKKSKPKK